MEKSRILEYYMSDDTPQCFPKYVQCYNGHNCGANYQSQFNLDLYSMVLNLCTKLETNS